MTFDFAVAYARNWGKGTRLLVLRSLEKASGAGLQLTNIIKDVFRDHQQGRYYIPREYLPFENGGTHQGLMPIVAHAYRNLCLGREYALADFHWAVSSVTRDSFFICRVLK